MTTPYRVEASGLKVVLPTRGPCWGPAACRVGQHDRRRRKTGPPWGWVAVLRCHTHGVSFTAYPPGHYPYGQVPLVDLALDGSDLSFEEGDDPLAGTLLQAASDAGRGELWARQGAPIPPDAVRSTQRRRLFGVAALLGLVVASASQGLSLELVAEVAQVPASSLFASLAALEKTRRLEAWGRQIQVVLERPLARRGTWVADRLAILGCLASRWGRPYRWTCGVGGRLIQLGKPFCGARSRDGP